MAQTIPTANVVLTSDYQKIKYYAARNSLKIDDEDKNTFSFSQDNPASHLLSFVHKTMAGEGGGGDAHSLVFEFVDPENTFESKLLSNNLDKNLPKQLSMGTQIEEALLRDIEEAEEVFKASQDKIMSELKGAGLDGGFDDDYAHLPKSSRWSSAGTGAAYGAVAGSWIPGVGAVAGAVVGAVAGAATHDTSEDESKQATLDRYAGDGTGDANWGRAAYHMARSIGWRGAEKTKSWTYNTWGAGGKSNYVSKLKNRQWYKDLSELQIRVDSLEEALKDHRQRKSKKLTKSLSLQQRQWYITYGVGNDFRTWAGPFSAKLVNLTYKYDAKGAPLIKLTFAGKVSSTFDQDWDLGEGLPTTIRGRGPQILTDIGAQTDRPLMDTDFSRVPPHETITTIMTEFVKAASGQKNVLVLLPDLNKILGGYYASILQNIKTTFGLDNKYDYIGIKTSGNPLNHSQPISSDSWKKFQILFRTDMAFYQSLGFEIEQAPRSGSEKPTNAFIAANKERIRAPEDFFKRFMDKDIHASLVSEGVGNHKAKIHEVFNNIRLRARSWEFDEGGSEYKDLNQKMINIVTKDIYKSTHAILWNEKIEKFKKGQPKEEDKEKANKEALKKFEENLNIGEQEVFNYLTKKNPALRKKLAKLTKQKENMRRLSSLKWTTFWECDERVLRIWKRRNLIPDWDRGPVLVCGDDLLIQKLLLGGVAKGKDFQYDLADWGFNQGDAAKFTKTAGELLHLAKFDVLRGIKPGLIRDIDNILDPPAMVTSWGALTDLSAEEVAGGAKIAVHGEGDLSGKAKDKTLAKSLKDANIPVFKSGVPNSNILSINIEDKGQYFQSLNVSYEQNHKFKMFQMLEDDPKFRKLTELLRDSNGNIHSITDKINDFIGAGDKTSLNLLKTWGNAVLAEGGLGEDYDATWDAIIDKANDNAKGKKTGKTISSASESVKKNINEILEEMMKVASVPTQGRVTHAGGQGMNTIDHMGVMTANAYTWAMTGTIKTLPYFHISAFRHLNTPCLLYVRNAQMSGTKPVFNPYNSWYSGIYHIMGFKHVISPTEVTSEFKIVRTPPIENHANRSEDADT
jgi:hypothetical protein